MAFDFIFFKIADFLEIKKTIFFRTYYEDVTLIANDFRKDLFIPIINDEKSEKIEILKNNVSVWGKIGSKINYNSIKNNNLNGIFIFLTTLMKKLKYTYLDRQLQSYNLLNKKK